MALAAVETNHAYVCYRTDGNSRGGLKFIEFEEGATSNQFFFNRRGLLCDKQTRTTPQGVTVLKYSQYKRVNGVMLPYRIEMEDSSGKVISTQVVESWTLGAVWPSNFFTPDGFRAF